MSPGKTRTLTARALNRAMLERQMLMCRSRMSVLKALEHLVGMQAQVPSAPYIGLWSRLEEFDHRDLSELMVKRRAVRIALMRSTIHLASARDCLRLRPVVQPVIERSFRGQFGRRLTGVDLAAVAARARALLEERPRTFSQLAAILQVEWPGRDALALTNLARAFLPLVQIPPRGVWGRSGQATHTSAESWLGRPLQVSAAPDELILRYLTAFGPATIVDVQAWSGLTRLSEAVERLKPRLRSYRNEQGKELLDVRNAPLPPPDSPAPPRFMPEYDNIFVAYADRGRIGDAKAASLVAGDTGPVQALLVDGFFRGTWQIERERDAATLVIRPLTPMSKGERADVADEGARLLAFAAAGARNVDVRFGARRPRPARGR